MSRTIEGKIVITADTDQAVHGAQVVREAYQRTGAAAAAAGREASAASDAAASAAAKQAGAAQQSASATSGLTAAQERFLSGLRESADLYGKSAAEVLRYRAAQMGVAKEAEASISTLERMGKAGHTSAAQTAAAWQQLPMQLQDAMVQLQGGVSPLTVLLQQGPQISGAFGGIGNTLRALGSIITPVRVACAGLVGALGALAVAAYQGYEESARLTKSLELTGGAAGVTRAAVMQMGDDIATAHGAAIGKVRQTLQALVDSGTFVGATLASAGRAVTAVQKITGASSEEIVRDFSDMRSGVASWAAEHNRTYNFLTADQYTYIRSLEAQGRSQEAMRVALDALAGTMEQRSVPALGSLERAWNSVGAALSSVWDKMKGIGREETAEEKLARLREKAAQWSSATPLKNASLMESLRGAFGGQEYIDSQRAQAMAQLDDAQRQAASDAMRATEKGIAAAQEQERIRQASKQYQDALAQVELAGSQQRLAQDQAAAQQRQSAQDIANARGLTSAVDHQAALNRIEQSRLQAQEAALQRQRGIEAGRVVEKPEDALARQAAVAGIDAQLVTVRAQIAKSVADGRALVEADALAQARDRAQQWAAAWRSAAEQVRGYAETNAATAAVRLTDPGARSDAEAAARSAGARRQLSDQQRDLRLQIDLVPAASPAARAELVRQLDALTREGEAHIAELERAGRFDSLRTQFGEYATALQQSEAAIDRLVTDGVINAVEAERRKFAERAKALPQLQALAAAQQKVAATAAERNDAAGAAQQVVALTEQRTEFEKALRSNAAASFAGFFSQVTSGAKTAGQALRDMVGGFAQSMLDVISKRLGEKMLNSVLDAVDKAGASGSGGQSSWVSTAASWIASFFHTGGIAGIGSSGGVRTASLPMAAWSFAPRYHSGGIAGLAPDEVPAVLRRGEEVLTESDPRHRANMVSRSVGPIGISISVTGADGSPAQQSDAARDLGAMMESAIDAWALKQSRPGGILWKG